MAQLLTFSRDVVLIDDEDSGFLSKQKLYALRVNGIPAYAHFCYVDLDGRRRWTYVHRWVMQAARGTKIDHVNRNGFDNQRVNLRPATSAQNAANMATSTGTSRFKGVYWNKQARKWGAVLKDEGGQHHLGFYADEAIAARAYDRRAVETWGEYARPNFPGAALVTDAELAATRRRTASPFRCVSWCTRTDKWVVRTKVDGFYATVGRFADETEAARAYDAFIVQHRPNAILNFPDTQAA